MVSQKIISVVMAAIMLACPLLDNGECCGECPAHHAAVRAENDAHQQHAERVKNSCCSHGHAPQLTTEMEHGDTPCNHRCPHSVPKTDCVCHGAVLPNHVHCPDHDLDFTWLDIEVCNLGIVAGSVDGVSQLAANYAFSHFPPLLSGRQMRVQVNSYLL